MVVRRVRHKLPKGAIQRVRLRWVSLFVEERICDDDQSLRARREHKNDGPLDSSTSTLWTITIRAGCALRILYVKGMTITMAAGGALSDNRESFLTNEASRVAGRCLNGTSEPESENEQLMYARRAQE